MPFIHSDTPPTISAMMMPSTPAMNALRRERPSSQAMTPPAMPVRIIGSSMGMASGSEGITRFSA